MSNFNAFLFGLSIATFLYWVRGGRGELEWEDEQKLRRDLCYRLCRWMPWETAKRISEKVPRAWL